MNAMTGILGRPAPMVGQPDWLTALDFTGSGSGIPSQVDTSVLMPNIGDVSAMSTAGIDRGLFGSGIGADDARFGLQGLNTLGNLWAAWKTASLAGKQFKYARDVSETNIANQIKSYNTSLTDRANNRAIVEGRTPAETQAYIEQNKMTRRNG